MEDAFTDKIVLGVPFMVFMTTFFVPRAVWNVDTGRYTGYFTRKVAALLLAVIGFNVFLGTQGDMGASNIASRAVLDLLLILIGSRIMVEVYHQDRFGVWLHRRYHLLTGHDDPRQPPE